MCFRLTTMYPVWSYVCRFNWNEMLLEEKDNLKILSLHYIQGVIRHAHTPTGWLASDSTDHLTAAQMTAWLKPGSNEDECAWELAATHTTLVSNS